MSQTLFASNATPSLPLLDANFNDVYGLANLFTTPTYTGTGTRFTLDATGNFTMTGAADFTMPDARWVKWGTGTAYVTGSAASGYVVFGTSSTERARIDSSGNFMVGTTAASNIPANGFNMVAATGSTQVGIGHSSGTATGTGFLLFSYNAGVIGSITQSGTTAVLFNTTSDRRLKTNIEDAADAGAVLDAIRVRSFDWATADEHVTHGFIAQELVTVAPQAVKVGDSGTAIEDAWGVDPSKLVALLVKEVQSLRARVTALEA